jgi:hypothetical protein
MSESLISIQQPTLGDIVTSPLSAFYRKKYEAAGRVQHSRDTLTTLPSLSFAELAATPYRERLYTTATRIPLVVRRDGMSAVFAQTLESLATEDYGAIGTRPLVGARILAQAIQVSAWCFGKGVLPLALERNPTIAVGLAERYEIDSLIVESDIAENLIASLDTRDISLDTLRHVTIFGSSFPLSLRELLRPHRAKTTVALQLPETGTVAHICAAQADDEFVFHPLPHVACEADGQLIISKFTLPTPLIRYETGLLTRVVNRSCSCNMVAFTVRDNTR